MIWIFTLLILGGCQLSPTKVESSSELPLGAGAALLDVRDPFESDLSPFPGAHPFFWRDYCHSVRVSDWGHLSQVFANKGISLDSNVFLISSRKERGVSNSQIISVWLRYLGLSNVQSVFSDQFTLIQKRRERNRAPSVPQWVPLLQSDLKNQAESFCL